MKKCDMSLIHIENCQVKSQGKAQLINFGDKGIMAAKDNLLTAEFLLANGFYDLKTYTEDGPGSWFPDSFDVEYTKEDTVLIEKEQSRQWFCVVINQQTGRISVWVQYNTGCGFTEIPNGFRQTTEKEFCALYEAIRREPLVK